MCTHLSIAAKYFTPNRVGPTGVILSETKLYALSLFLVYLSTFKGMQLDRSRFCARAHYFELESFPTVDGGLNAFIKCIIGGIKCII